MAKKLDATTDPESTADDAATAPVEDTPETAAAEADYIWCRVAQDTPTLAFGGWGTLHEGQLVEASARQAEAHPDLFRPLTPAEVDELVPDPDRHPGRNPSRTTPRG